METQLRFDMLYFGDDSCCSSCGNVRQQDVFLFGGYYVAAAELKKLEKRIGEIKTKYGSNERLPLKWNFRDLKPVYVAAGQDVLFQTLLAQSDAIRLEFLQLLTEFNATVLIAGIRGHSLNDLKTRRDYHSWALTMILQRLGFDCGREDSTDTMKIQVMLDWPGADIQKAHFEVGHKAYHDGESCDGQKYKAGPLRAKGFFPALTYSSTEHNPFLQLADMTVGACTDFCKWSFSGKPVPPRLKDMFPIVFQQVRQVHNYDRFTTGFAIAPLAFFQHMRKQYTEFWKQVQPQP